MISVLLNKEIRNEQQYIIRRWDDQEIPRVTGVEISASKVYSVCPGRVVAIGWTYQCKWSVSVLVNSTQMVRYCNLQRGYVREGQIVDFKTLIGESADYVRFEYCTADKGKSVWPVRINSLLMYKQDPAGLLSGDVKLSVSMNNVHVATGNEELIPLDKHTLAEFTGNRGDE